jgi:hypothetical protein
MADWVTISSLATAGGTLVLAVATFASVRSANRSARIAEVALREQRRPVLVQSRLDDPEQKIMFVDRHWVRAPPGGAGLERADGTVYLAMSLRNVGAGIAVCLGWNIRSGLQGARVDHAAESDFRTQTRDLYVPAGDVGIWQGALRDPSDTAYRDVAEAIESREPLTIELLYSDQVGGQRTISRFTIVPSGQDDEQPTRWLLSVGRHWYLDGRGPGRPAL